VGTPAPRHDGHELAAARLAHAQAAPPLGSIAPRAPVQGRARAVTDDMPGMHPPTLLDLVGERLAFERTGTRLYEALAIKLEAANPQHEGAPHREDIERIRDEELLHFGLLSQAAESLCGDPTSLTPAADVTGVTARGLVDAVTDPRTTLTEALKAVLVAELVDNDGWLVLADVAARLGHEELGRRFRAAMAEEEEHLARVRAWVTAAIDHETGLGPEAPRAIEPAPQSLGNIDAKRV
jgi:hypothetical protein